MKVVCPPFSLDDFAHCHHGVKKQVSERASVCFGDSVYMQSFTKEFMETLFGWLRYIWLAATYPFTYIYWLRSLIKFRASNEQPRATEIIDILSDDFTEQLLRFCESGKSAYIACSPCCGE